MRPDLCRNVSTDTSTPSRIESMETAGLLKAEDRGRSVLPTLTYRVRRRRTLSIINVLILSCDIINDIIRDIISDVI